MNFFQDHPTLTPIEVAVCTALQCWVMIIGLLGIADHRITMAIKRKGQR